MSATSTSSSSIPQLIADAAAKYGVDPNLALNVAITESALDQSAVSSAGAIGVFQLMPATAAGLGVDPTNLEQNIDGGVRYLAQLLSQFGNAQEALGAYNWGPGNVQNAIAQYGGDWLSYAPEETQNYVAKILGPSASFTTSVTPASFAAGTIGAATQAVESIVTGLSPTQWALLLGGGALLYYVLSEILD